MTRPFVPLFASSLGVGYLGVGVAAAAIGLLPILFAVPVGSLTDRIGVRPMVITGAILNAVGFALLWTMPSLGMIVVTQLIAGFSNLLVTLSVQTHVGMLGKGADADRNFSTLAVFASIGQIGGPLISGSLITLGGFGAAFGAAAAMSTVCALTAIALLPRLVRSREAEPKPRSARRAGAYLRDPDTQLAILASCLMSVPDVLRTSFLPVYLGDNVQLDPGLIGYVITVYSVSGLVAKAVLPRAVARFGRQAMLFAFTVGCALTLIALPSTTSVWVVGIMTAAMGLTFGLGRPLSMAMAANAATPGEEGYVVALRLSGNRAADFGLPMVFGFAASTAGIGAAFLCGAALLFVGAGALFRPMINERRHREEGSA